MKTLTKIFFAISLLLVTTAHAAVPGFKAEIKTLRSPLTAWRVAPADEYATPYLKRARSADKRFVTVKEIRKGMLFAEARSQIGNNVYNYFFYIAADDNVDDTEKIARLLAAVASKGSIILFMPEQPTFSSETTPAGRRSRATYRGFLADVTIGFNDQSFLAKDLLSEINSSDVKSIAQKIIAKTLSCAGRLKGESDEKP